GVIGEKIGLQAGDHITEIDGKPVMRFEELLSSKVLMGNTTLTVVRGAETLSVAVPGDILNDVADHDRNEFVGVRSRTMAVDSVVAGSVAEKAGMRSGDSILSINNTAVPFWDQVTSAIGESKGKTIALRVLRGSDTTTIRATVPEEG